MKTQKEVEEMLDKLARDFCRETPRMKEESGVVFFDRLKNLLANIHQIRQSDREAMVEMCNSKKKKVIVNMLQEDEIYNERGMDGVKGYNQALTDILSELNKLMI